MTVCSDAGFKKESELSNELTQFQALYFTILSEEVEWIKQETAESFDYGRKSQERDEQAKRNKKMQALDMIELDKGLQRKRESKLCTLFASNIHYLTSVCSCDDLFISTWDFSWDFICRPDGGS